MKVKENVGFLRLAGIAVLCAGIAFIVSTCNDDECKKCTNSANGEVWEACDDELKEAKLLPNVTCK